MIRWTRGLTVAFLVTVVIPTASAAQRRPQTSVAGLGVRYAVPQDAMKDTYEPGYGFTWTSLGDMGSMWMSMSGGWTRFKGTPMEDPEAEGGESAPPTISQAEFLLGMGLKLGNLWVGAKAGYFFKDQDEWDVLPTAILQFGTLVLTGEGKVLGDVRWYGVQASWMTY